MMFSKSRLLSTTVIPFVAGAGVIVGTALISSAPSQATATRPAPVPLPAAKPRPNVRLVACNPCNPCAAKKACNPCNPCAAKACNPCNPCAAKNPRNPCNPCNPCGAGGGAVSTKCFVPRLVAAWKTSPCNPCSPCYAAKKACNPCNPCAAKNPCNPCNPCAAKNPCNPCNPCAAKNPCSPCNPCAAKNPCNPCNPCAAKNPCNPCNPCAAKQACNPCNPCAAKNPCNPCNPCAARNPCSPCSPCNPCNPCGASAAVEISPREAAAVYDCLRTEMTPAYEKAGVAAVAGYTNWTNVATQPYPSATHGSRYVNNYANARGAYKYVKYEDVGTMPAGAAIAKDSFVVNANGTVSVGPLFVMEKMTGGFNAESHDWRYSLIMPTGAVVGVTGGKGSANVKFCIECHASVADDQDSLFFLPDDVRETFN